MNPPVSGWLGLMTLALVAWVAWVAHRARRQKADLTVWKEFAERSGYDYHHRVGRQWPQVVGRMNGIEFELSIRAGDRTLFGRETTTFVSAAAPTLDGGPCIVEMPGVVVWESALRSMIRRAVAGESA